MKARDQHFPHKKGEKKNCCNRKKTVSQNINICNNNPQSTRYHIGLHER